MDSTPMRFCGWIIISQENRIQVGANPVEVGVENDEGGEGRKGIVYAVGFSAAVLNASCTSGIFPITDLLPNLTIFSL
jgi:hypothetical protein